MIMVEDTVSTSLCGRPINNSSHIFNLLNLLWLHSSLIQGEPGVNSFQTFGDLEAAKKAFGKKFTDKTKNKWEDRDNFVPAAGKYTLIEVEDADEDEVEEAVKKVRNFDL